MKPESIHFRFSNQALHENTSYFLDMTEECLSQFQINQKTVFKLLIAVEEIIVNIISYAYPETVGSIDLDVQLESDTLTLIFSDEGIAFNPLSNQNDQRNLPLIDRKEGGLGIILSKEFADDLEYKRQNHKNILTLKKNIR